MPLSFSVTVKASSFSFFPLASKHSEKDLLKIHTCELRKLLKIPIMETVSDILCRWSA